MVPKKAQVSSLQPKKVVLVEPAQSEQALQELEEPKAAQIETSPPDTDQQATDPQASAAQLETGLAVEEEPKGAGQPEQEVPCPPNEPQLDDLPQTAARGEPEQLEIHLPDRDPPQGAADALDLKAEHEQADELHVDTATEPLPSPEPFWRLYDVLQVPEGAYRGFRHSADGADPPRLDTQALKHFQSTRERSPERPGSPDAALPRCCTQS